MLAVIALAVLTRVVQQVIPLPALSNMLTFAGVLWLVSCFYASLYFSVVDCFEGAQQEGADATLTPDQADPSP